MPIDPRTMPPELLKVMIEMSGDPEEKSKVAEQFALAKLLAARATGVEDKAPSGTVGGIGHVIGKGILGYGAHRDKAAADAKLEALRSTNMKGREAWMRAMYGGNKLPETQLGGGEGYGGMGLEDDKGLTNVNPDIDPNMLQMDPSIWA